MSDAFSEGKKAFSGVTYGMGEFSQHVRLKQCVAFCEEGGRCCHSMYLQYEGRWTAHMREGHLVSSSLHFW